mgnify:CR=1 FL=1
MQRDEIGGFAEDGSPVIGRITSFTPGTMPEAHAHWRGQLAWCPDRPVTVETGRPLPLLPPGMRIWRMLHAGSACPPSAMQVSGVHQAHELSFLMRCTISSGTCWLSMPQRLKWGREMNTTSGR